jgi:hypothetical protein
VVEEVTKLGNRSERIHIFFLECNSSGAIEEVIQALESLMKNPQIFLDHNTLGVAE